MFYTVIGRLATLLFVGFLLLSGPVRAEEDAAVTAHPALWQVEKNGGKVYLLGSFHLLPKNYIWYEGIVKQSFEAADELVMEAKMTPEATAAIQAMVIQNGFFTGGDSLKAHLDPEHYAKMLMTAKRLMGVNEDAAQKMKPWFMALQISIISIMSSGMDPNSGVDKYLEGLATQGNKTISGLETAQDSMNALINHPVRVQSAMLSDTLDKLDDFKTYIQSYLDAWASGNMDMMSTTMIDDMKSHPEMYQALLVKRNENWLPAIENHIAAEKTIFIVVGAAHLAGPDGLVRMLEAKGYNVEKIQ